jgi:hypothetical protein
MRTRQSVQSEAGQADQRHPEAEKEKPLALGITNPIDHALFSMPDSGGIYTRWQ